VNFRTLSAMALPVKTVLAIGETGAGKSFLCNQLVGWPAFDESDDTKSKTDKCTREIAADRSMGVEYHVIDTVGLRDTHKSEAEVHECLSEFARLAPNGIDAVLCVVTLTGGRLKAYEVELFGKIECYFGKSVWESAIVVFNNSKKTPEQIWSTDGTPSVDKLLKKWRESGTVICTVPPGKEDDEGNLVVESIATQIGLLKQAIVNTSNVYNSDEFRKVRAELNRKAEQALRSFKTDSWRTKMQEENVLLLQGQLSLADWERKKAKLLNNDAQAESERRERDAATARANRIQQELDDANEKERKRLEKEAKDARDAAEEKRLEKEAKNARDAAEKKKRLEANDAKIKVGGAGGLATGAGVGALAGGPPGAVIGAVVGALSGLFGGKLAEDK